MFKPIKKNRAYGIWRQRGRLKLQEGLERLDPTALKTSNSDID